MTIATGAHKTGGFSAREPRPSMLTRDRVPSIPSRAEVRRIVGDVSGVRGDVNTHSDEELSAMLAILGDVRSVINGLAVEVLGELGRRAASGGHGGSSVVRSSGPPALVASLWQIPAATAQSLCAVANALTPERSLLGEELPPAYPFLAEAVLGGSGFGAGEAGDAETAGVPAGHVSVEQAAVIVRELAKAAPACSRADCEKGERLLVEFAPSLTVEEVRRLAVQVRDRLDDEGIEPRESRLRRRRSLTLKMTPDGLTQVNWLLDPESAGYVVSAIDAIVGHELRKPRFVENGAESPPGSPAETRSLAQLRSDAATEIFRHRAGCSSADTEGAPVTVVVRMGLEQLLSGIGVAEIDGVAEPISAATARRMAADAAIIPLVLGGTGEVLDLGRSRRLFSKAQKLALAERDGGCAWAGCSHPPSYTEAHHIRWWNAHGGATDLNNGVLLCSRHHHRIHDDGWQIDVRANVPYFIPPAHVDARRRPLRGGRVRVPASIAAETSRLAS